MIIVSVIIIITTAITTAAATVTTRYVNHFLKDPSEELMRLDVDSRGEKESEDVVFRGKVGFCWEQVLDKGFPSPRYQMRSIENQVLEENGPDKERKLEEVKNK